MSRLYADGSSSDEDGCAQYNLNYSTSTVERGFVFASRKLIETKYQQSRLCYKIMRDFAVYILCKGWSGENRTSTSVTVAGNNVNSNNGGAGRVAIQTIEYQLPIIETLNYVKSFEDCRSFCELAKKNLKRWTKLRACNDWIKLAVGIGRATKSLHFFEQRREFLRSAESIVLREKDYIHETLSNDVFAFTLKSELKFIASLDRDFDSLNSDSECEPVNLQPRKKFKKLVRSTKSLRLMKQLRNDEEMWANDEYTPAVKFSNITPTSFSPPPSPSPFSEKLPNSSSSVSAPFLSSSDMTVPFIRAADFVPKFTLKSVRKRSLNIADCLEYHPGCFYVTLENFKVTNRVDRFLPDLSCSLNCSWDIIQDQHDDGIPFPAKTNHPVITQRETKDRFLFCKLYNQTQSVVESDDVSADEDISTDEDESFISDIEKDLEYARSGLDVTQNDREFRLSDFSNPLTLISRMLVRCPLCWDYASGSSVMYLSPCQHPLCRICFLNIRSHQSAFQCPDCYTLVTETFMFYRSPESSRGRLAHFSALPKRHVN